MRGVGERVLLGIKVWSTKGRIFRHVGSIGLSVDGWRWFDGLKGIGASVTVGDFGQQTLE